MRTVLVTPADVSLFHVAARELGNARDWIRIAEANGIVDPMIRTSGTLRIPTGQASSTTGLPRANPYGSAANPPNRAAIAAGSGVSAVSPE